MQRKAYYIQREVGSDLGYVDCLSCLWEGNDLPAFDHGEPYLFSDMAVVERVANRLSARYPETQPIPGLMSALPITYTIVTIEWDDCTCPCCGNLPACSEQHVSQFLEAE